MTRDLYSDCLQAALWLAGVRNDADPMGDDVTWVAIGAEVIERSSAGWGALPRYGSVKKIAKIYKNSNFVLEGDAQQWRAFGDIANKTGASHYDSTVLVPLTDEVSRDIATSKTYNTAVKVVRNEADRLEKVWRGKNVEDTIAEAAKIKGRE